VLSEIAAALAGVEPKKEPPWPRRCGYCQSEVEQVDGSGHWRRGRVSRCHHRQEPSRV
jgi:hypothetical protein